VGGGSGSVHSFIVTGQPGTQYRIQTTRAWRAFDWTNRGERSRLFLAWQP
jgi:hypothetical protein